MIKTQNAKLCEQLRDPISRLHFKGFWMRNFFIKALIRAEPILYVFEFIRSFLVKLSKPEYLYLISKISQNLFPVSYWPKRELLFYILKTSFAWITVPLISGTWSSAGLLTRNFSWGISNVELRSTLGSFSMKFHIQYDAASSRLRTNTNGIVFGKVMQFWSSISIYTFIRV